MKKQKGLPAKLHAGSLFFILIIISFFMSEPILAEWHDTLTNKVKETIGALSSAAEKDSKKNIEQSEQSKSEPVSSQPETIVNPDNKIENKGKQNPFVSFSPLVKKASPSVVNLYAFHVIENRVINPFLGDPFFEYFFGALEGNQAQTRQEISKSSGSGVIISADGLIVTCAHVVQDASVIAVALVDGRQYEADVLRVDKKQDLALLKVKNAGQMELPYLSIGDSDKVEVGDVVVALGNSFGMGQSVTTGIISAVARPFMDRLLLQTDAAVNPGNSGGALVNMDGELIAIPNAILSKTGASHGIGFGIPSALVKAMLRSLKPGQTRAWSGFYVQTLTPKLIESLNEQGFKQTRGAIVTRLHPLSPAGKAGVLKGDIILEIDVHSVVQQADLQYRLLLTEVDKEITLKIWRQGKIETIKFKPIAPPETPVAEKTKLEGEHMLNGLVVANLSPAVALQHDLDEQKSGVVVLEMPALKQGGRRFFSFMPGDVILQVNEEKINAVADLKSVLDNVRKKPLRLLVLEREGQEVVLRVG